MKSIFSKKPIFVIVFMVFVSCSKNVEIVHPEIEINFSANNEIIYEGDDVSYTDESTGDPTNWEWIFNGGTPLSSNEQNPRVKYETKGIYDVSLQASNANKSNVISKVGFITVKSSFDRGLIGHYLLDGNANDDTGNQTSGTIIENANLTQDRFDNANSAYEFNEGNDRIDIKTNYSVNNSFSVG